MKIAFIGQKGVPVQFGGVERHVEEVAIRLAKNGHQIFVYCRPWYTPENIKNYKGVNLIHLPSIKTKHLDAITHTFLATWHAIFSDYDIIHYQAVGPALLSFLPRIFKPSAKVIVTFHCIDRKHKKWNFLARLALKIGEWAACNFPHQTIVVSRTLQYYCSQVYDRDTVYLPNGVSISQSSGQDLIKNKFALEKNSYILAVSRLVRHKGIHYLIEAYKNLKTDKKLVIVGGSAFTDDYVKELKQLVGSNQNIIFTGNQSGEMLDQLFSNPYLLVHPSESEGLPLAVLEAMAHGKTVLASNINENLEVVKGHGFTFKNKDIDDLTDKLNYLLQNPVVVSNVGEEAREYVYKVYNWDNIVKQTELFYKEVLDCSSHKKLAKEGV